MRRYIRITDITDTGELNADVRAPGGQVDKWQRYRLEDGDFLVARSGATVGKAYRHRDDNGECVFAGYLIRFRPDQGQVDPDYLFAVTRTSGYRAWVAARQNVVAQPNINAKHYGHELQIPLPPLDLQHRFAARDNYVRSQRAAVRRASAVDSELFASLQARAFRGDL